MMCKPRDARILLAAIVVAWGWAALPAWPSGAPGDIKVCLETQLKEREAENEFLQTGATEFIGLLVETAQGKFLALGSYLMRHPALLAQVELFHGKVTRIYWMGEAKTGPPSPNSALSRGIAHINVT